MGESEVLPSLTVSGIRNMVIRTWDNGSILKKSKTVAGQGKREVQPERSLPPCVRLS